MASVRIEEFASLHLGREGMSPAAQIDDNTVFQQVTIGGASAQSAAFGGSTRLIRVQAEALACIKIGANPTAATTNLRMTAGQTEYFGVNPGDKLACITTT